MVFWNGEDFPPTAFFYAPRLDGQGRDSLAIESSLRYGEESGVLAIFFKRHGKMIEVALVVEARLSQKLGVILVRLWLGSPRVELCQKRSGAALRVGSPATT